MNKLLYLNLFSRIYSTMSNQTDIVLVKKFSQWNYVSSSIRYRMPYLSVNSKNALLTTAENPDQDFYGTIIAKNRTYIPAPWIQDVAENPLHIWYWIREAKGLLLLCYPVPKCLTKRFSMTCLSEAILSTMCPNE